MHLCRLSIAELTGEFTKNILRGSAGGTRLSADIFANAHQNQLESEIKRKNVVVEECQYSHTICCLNILGLSRRVEVKAKFKLNSKWHEPEHDLIGSSNIHLVFS